MARVGVRELRMHVAEVLRRAADGETITITANGRPVARLGPLELDGAPTVDDLVRAGKLEAPRRPGGRARAASFQVPADTSLPQAVRAVRR